MAMRLFATCRAGVAVALAAVATCAAAAKAPKLLAESLEVVVEGQPVQVETIPVMPTKLPPNRTFEEFLYEMLHQAGARERGVSDAASDPAKLAAARRMFQIGERCRRKGDLDMAYNCYEETLRLCPHSSYASVACEKAAEITARKASVAASGEEEAVAPPPPPASEDAAPEAQDARAMYLIGERCRRRGDLGMARNCYREAQLLAPGSTYGRRAVKRLRQIEAGRAADAEEQEPPLLPPQQEPPQADPPVVFVPPPPRHLTIEVNEPESDGPPHNGPRPASKARPAAPTFDFDIEIAPARNGAGLRGEGTFLLGKFGYKVTYDDYDGHYQLVVVPSKP